MGNPTSYDGTTLTWEGKQLSGAGTTTFSYDENGLRTRKTVNGTVTDYYYNGSVLIGMVTGSTVQSFSYDSAGNVVSVNYAGTEYYYLRNGQNDVVKLIDNSGDAVVEYIYDSWAELSQRPAPWQLHWAQISRSVIVGMCMMRRLGGIICNPVTTIPKPAGLYPQTCCCPPGRACWGITALRIVWVIR